MIKSVVAMIILQILLVSPTLAEEKAVTMKSLLDGMNLIQLGFLTNTELLIEEGVFEVNYGKEILRTVHKSKYLSFDEAQSFKYTQETLKKITIHLDLLLKEYKAGETLKAMQEYQLLMNQCISCHMKLRDYKDRGVGFKDLQQIP
jgi:hypothetical protein